MADQPARQLVVENQPSPVQVSDPDERVGNDKEIQTRRHAIETRLHALLEKAPRLLYDDEPQRVDVFNRLLSVKKALANLDRNLEPSEALDGADFEVTNVDTVIKGKEILARQHNIL